MTLAEALMPLERPLCNLQGWTDAQSELLIAPLKILHAAWKDSGDPRYEALHTLEIRGDRNQHPSCAGVATGYFTEERVVLNTLFVEQLGQYIFPIAIVLAHELYHAVKDHQNIGLLAMYSAERETHGTSVSDIRAMRKLYAKFAVGGLSADEILECELLSHACTELYYECRLAGNKLIETTLAHFAVVNSIESDNDRSLLNYVTSVAKEVRDNGPYLGNCEQLAENLRAILKSIRLVSRNFRGELGSLRRSYSEFGESLERVVDAHMRQRSFKSDFTEIAIRFGAELMASVPQTAEPQVDTGSV